MKKTLLIFLLAASASLPAFSAEGHRDVIDGIVYDMWQYDDGAIEATVMPVDEMWLNKGVKQYSGDLVIPSTVTYKGVTYTVMRILENTFKDCYDLTSIAIPPTMKEIGPSAFWNADNLKAVYIEDLKAWCEIKLARISATNPLEYAHDLYLNGQLLTDIDIPEGITKVGYMQFYGCSMERVTVPEGVTLIEHFAFNSCPNLKQISLPSSLEEMQNGVFYSCKSLESITIPERMTSIERETFYNCESLQEVVLPEGLENIGLRAFGNCYSLRRVNYPESLKTIGTSAFYTCTSLEEPVFPQGLETISKTAFYSVKNWRTLNLPPHLSALGEASVFCDNLEIFTIAAKEMPERLGENPPFPFADDAKIAAAFPTESLADYRNNSRFKYFMQDNNGEEKPRITVSLYDDITLEFTKETLSEENYLWGILEGDMTVFTPKYTKIVCRLPEGLPEGCSIAFNGENITSTLSGNTFTLPYVSSDSTLEISPLAGIDDITSSNDDEVEVFTINGLRMNSADIENLPSGVYILRHKNGEINKVIK